MDKQNCQWPPPQPHHVGSIQTPTMARAEIWPWNHDKRNQAGCHTPRQSQLQDLECTRGSTKHHKGTTQDPHHLWRVWAVQPSDRTAYQQGENVLSTLPRFHKPQQETGCFPWIPPTAGQHTTKPLYSGLFQMGQNFTPVMGQDAMEINPLLL